MAELYEICWRCKGDRDVRPTVTEIRMFGKQIIDKPRCPICNGLGFIATGLTTDQVDRLVRRERERLGDPLHAR